MNYSRIALLLCMATMPALAVSSTTDPQASFETQLRQAQAEIQRLADQGWMYTPTPQVGSFDTQLNEAKRRIAEIAEQGLKK